MKQYQVLNLKSKSNPDSVFGVCKLKVSDIRGISQNCSCWKIYALEDAYNLSEALIHGGLANKTNVEITWYESEEFEKMPTGLNKYDAS